MISADDLQAELKKLEQQREQMVANIHAIDGAMLMLKQLIEKAGQAAP